MESKRNEVLSLLHLISLEVQNILDQEELSGGDILSAEDMILLATETVLKEPNVFTKEKSPLLVQISKTDVQFVIDEDYVIQLYPPEEEYEDED